MKFEEKKYAQALYDVLKAASFEKTEEIVTRFVALLGKNGHIKRAPKIISEFEKIYNKHEGILSAELRAARKMTSPEIKEILKNLEKIFQKKMDIEVRVDPALLGGIEVKAEGRIFKASLRSRLEELRGQLAQLL